MKLYFRRQTLTSKTMLTRRTEIGFSLYARLDVDQEERSLIQEFALESEILGSHVGLIPGCKDPTKSDNLMEHVYGAGTLLQGKDISCISFVNMMGLEQDMARRCRIFADVLDHARDIKNNQEALYDFSGDQAAARTAA